MSYNIITSQITFHGEPHTFSLLFQSLPPKSLHIVHHCSVSPPFIPLSLPGPMVSQNSVPNNLDGNKTVERRPSKVGVSRESSSVDFSKVT